MIKARATDRETGEELLIFGISEMNVQKLKQGQPIRINLTEMGAGLKGTVLIFYGKTELDMTKELEPFLGPDTKVADLTGGNTQGGTQA